MTSTTPRNLYTAIPTDLPDELFETLLAQNTVKIERIVSRGHVTPSGEWYDQAGDEWVLLLQGAAQLAYEDGELIDLHPGDYLLIPAHARHRVAWTAPDADSIWLAVHVGVSTAK